MDDYSFISRKTMSRIQFQNNKYYHVYNRGIEKRDIFMDYQDFVRFIRSMREFNVVQPIGSLYEKDYKKTTETKSPIGDLVSSSAVSSPLVNLISYSLIPNHYHFMIEQLEDKGISKFMHKLNLGYSMYFNKRYNRSGSLFEGPFKIKEVNSYSHFLKLLVYVNCNYEVHKLGKSKDWIWSSYLDSIGARNGSLCNLDVVKNEFRDLNEFKNFCNQVLPDIIKIKELKKYLLE